MTRLSEAPEVQAALLPVRAHEHVRPAVVGEPRIRRVRRRRRERHQPALVHAADEGDAKRQLQVREPRGLLEVENVDRHAGVRVRVHPEKGVRLPLQPESHWPKEEQVGREGLRRAGGRAGVRPSILALLLLVRVALCHQHI
mgnify:CR=1 FL=1